MSLLSVALLLTFVCYALAGPAILPGMRPGQVPVLAAPEIPRPYEYGYEFGDGQGMTQHRREVADGTGVVKGNYGYLDPIGVYRRVEYTAGADGYKAVIHSNEPGLSSHTVGDAVYIVELPPPAAVAQGLRPAAVAVASA
ncbi:cuticle protein 10.9-like [Parasteatoda tepidariorum]|uniref:cuticle protein 10.9-like n=1 Tax=Parasteatoda tepidariorum TaxID=114398 RepID=UPI00077FDFD8|nr:cuticle protein 10.9-like [Parasteatoda tepidariorum]